MPHGGVRHLLPPAARQDTLASQDALRSVIGVEITSTPVSGNTYELAETIVLRVRFSRPVVVTGTPKLVLAMGRSALYNCPGCTARRTWMDFEYTVQSSDRAENGIDLGPDALVLNGGTITVAGGTTAIRSPDLTEFVPVAGRADHLVDGRVERAPLVSRVTITSAPTAGASVHSSS